jgi:endonuclease-3
LILCAQKLIKDFNGEVPRTLEELTSLAGVGRKTANVIRGNIYRDPSIVVDTHVSRISKKLGFTKEKEPDKIEQDLMRILPKEHWILFNIQVISHGRKICKARNPDCEKCFLKHLCSGVLLPKHQV